MADNFLTTASSIQCMHGGTAILTTDNTSLYADGALVLLETDVADVMGCINTLPGPKPSPCTKITWSAGTEKVTVNGVPALVESSVGKCFSAEKAPQGMAVIGGTQTKGAGL